LTQSFTVAVGVKVAGVRPLVVVFVGEQLMLIKGVVVVVIVVFSYSWNLALVLGLL
jgi:hypothetical protein